MARRGRNIYLVLIAPIVVECVAAIVIAVSGDWNSIDWSASVLTPLWIVVWFGLLYLTGDRPSLVLSVIHCLFPGAALLIYGIGTKRIAQMVRGGTWPLSHGRS